MTVKPSLPPGTPLPQHVNGWQHAPESPTNGHIWRSPCGESSVGVFCTTGSAYAKVVDERVDGFASSSEIARDGVPDAETISARQEQKENAVASVLEEAVEWMAQNGPPWRSESVNDAALVAPDGYELVDYYLEERTTEIYYRLEGAEDRQRPAARELDDVPEPETYPYVRIHCWNGSGNCSVMIAPWRRAHDEQCFEIVDPPEECGLDLALKLARDWIRENVDSATTDPPKVGQSDLAAFSDASR